MPNNPEDKEVKATEALITAALHIWDHDATKEEIEVFLGNECILSKEDEAALGRLGENPLKPKIGPNEAQPEASHSEQEALLALHRKRPAGGFSETTEAEIIRSREELLQKLKKKKETSE